MVFKIQAFMCSAYLKKKIENSKYPLKLGKASLHRYPVGKKFAKFALSGTVFETQAFLCFAIFAKN